MTPRQAHAKYVQDAGRSGWDLNVSLKGKGIGESKTFVVSQDRQFFAWFADVGPNGIFQVRIMDADTKRVVSRWSNGNRKGWGTQPGHLRPGRYYADVMTGGDWWIEMMEISTDPPEPSGNR
jgi:hypothetical protein